MTKEPWRCKLESFVDAGLHGITKLRLCVDPAWTIAVSLSILRLMWICNVVTVNLDCEVISKPHVMQA